MTARSLVPPRSPAVPIRDDHGFLEICVESLASARAAIAGGADQLELCSALALGGLTPSTGLAEAVVSLAHPAGVRVRAMVRPRAGDFAYDADDLAVATKEAAALLDTGLDGLVFGAARGGAIDTPVVAKWCGAVRAAAGRAAAGLTFHRAIDTVASPEEAVDAIIDLGFDQILSSGGEATALQGVRRLAAMARRADGRCRLVAAAGVTPDIIDELMALGVPRAIHASARPASQGAVSGDDRFGFGRTPVAADVAIVAALRRCIDQLQA